jgi:D-alanine--D-alanine ligase
MTHALKTKSATSIEPDGVGLPNLLRVAVFVGGPSQERGISLHSARTFNDHLPDGVVVNAWYYVQLRRQVNGDRHFVAWKVEPVLLYRNTPQDFDSNASIFSARRGIDLGTLTAKGGYELPDDLESERSIKKLLEEPNVDLCIPLIHGVFGEDGSLQRLLDECEMSYLGSGSSACGEMLDKHVAWQKAGESLDLWLDNNDGVDHSLHRLHIRRASAFPKPIIVTNASEIEGVRERIEALFKETGAGVVKPTKSGSSIGVRVVRTADDCFTQIKEMQDAYKDEFEYEFIIEPLRTGREFTVIVLDTASGPIALLPTEIKKRSPGMDIFDYHMKYHPTRDVEYVCPPNFSSHVIRVIRDAACELFRAFKMRHFARLDGWVDDEDKLYFTDFNPISGLDHASLLFQQVTMVGFTHQSFFRHVLQRAMPAWQPSPKHPASEEADSREPIAILFGGESAERQISVHSGVNVWLKLLRSDKWKPQPYLLIKHDNAYWVWTLSYECALYVTVENIENACLRILSCDPSVKENIGAIRTQLGISQSGDVFHAPRRQLLKSFLDSGISVFNVLHGGIGENGVLAEEFERLGIRATGPSSKVYRLCMNKGRLLETVSSLIAGNQLECIQTPVYETRKWSELEELVKAARNCTSVYEFGDDYLRACSALWETITTDLRNRAEVPNAPKNDEHIIVKPIADGSSVGVVKLEDSWALAVYLWATSRLAARTENQKLDRGLLSRTTLGKRLRHNIGSDAAATVELAKPSSMSAEPQPPPSNDAIPKPESSSTFLIDEIPMPLTPPNKFLFEQFVERFDLLKGDAETIYTKDPRYDRLLQYLGNAEGEGKWVEITCGLVGRRDHVKSLPPSISLSAGVLSQEEKFLKGEGVNLLLFPRDMQRSIPQRAKATVAKVRKTLKTMAKLLGLQSVTRVDAFMQLSDGQLRIIEINCNPALTPATVLFHQALAHVSSVRRPREKGCRPSGSGAAAGQVSPRTLK